MSSWPLPQIGDELGENGKYHIRGRLGRGGQGTLYLAWDSEVHRQVAIKVALDDQARSACTMRRLPWPVFKARWWSACSKPIR